MIKEAIAHYKYGIAHDIFSEPVTSYAKLSITALEKQIPQKPIGDSNFYLNELYCPSCKKFLGFLHNAHSNFCGNCGQALDWSK